MNFTQVALCFERVEQESSRLVITELLAEVLSAASLEEAAFISYLSLGYLNPVYKGTQFHIAEKSMLQIVSLLCDMSAEDVLAMRKELGDIGLVVARHNWEIEGQSELSVLQVRDELAFIHDISGEGSVEAKSQAIISFLRKLDSLSAKFIVRMIIGKLRLGFSDMTLLDAFSWSIVSDKSLRPMLEHAYNITVDIGKIITVLKQEGVAGIEKIKITPGIPIRPAAAERLSDAQAIVAKLGRCLAQPKIDGFRVQLHVYEHQGKMAVSFFSRNLKDMSAMFPELTSDAQKLSVSSLVAEGEAIAYDVQTDMFLPFQETVKRKRKHDIDGVAAEFPLKLFLFDVLYLNGESCLDKTHVERRKIMKDLFSLSIHAQLETLAVIEEQVIDTAQDLEIYFNNTISLGLEGLVIKKPDAQYIPGKRNFNWVKLKRQETGHIDDTLDCVILGYYHGHGKRASFGIGAFLIGVYNAKRDIFETVAKIGTGLSDAQWRALKKRCDDTAMPGKPSNVSCHKDLYPDVWVMPEIVCAIRADEISRSPLHQAGADEHSLGFALRFPRIMAYRDDKSPADATTVSEVAHLYKIQYAGTKDTK